MSSEIPKNGRRASQQRANSTNKRHDSTNRRKCYASQGDKSKRPTGYNVFLDGKPLIFHILRKLSCGNTDGVLWEDIRSAYRKEIGCTLNSTELNLICGTKGKTIKELLQNDMQSILSPVDNAYVRVTLAAPTSSPNSPTKPERSSEAAAGMSTSSALEWQDAELEEQQAILEQRRKDLVAYLRAQGLVNENQEPLNEKNNEENENHLIEPRNSDANVEDLLPLVDAVSENLDEVFEKNFQEEEIDVNMDGVEIANLGFEDEHASNGESEEDQEEALVQFERSVLEHRNSMGSLGNGHTNEEKTEITPLTEQENDTNDDNNANDEKTKAVPSTELNEASDSGNANDEKAEAVLLIDQNDISVAQEASTNSGNGPMNAAFLASESELLSFEYQENNLSNSQDFTTPPRCSDHDTPLVQQEYGYSGPSNANLNIPQQQPQEREEKPEIAEQQSEDTEAVDQQPAALCSSRIEDDTEEMPQPDVSPVIRDESENDRDLSIQFHANDLERPTLEERVPHLHYVRSKSEADRKKTDDAAPAVTKKTAEAHEAETDDDFYDEDSVIGEDHTDKAPSAERPENGTANQADDNPTTTIAPPPNGSINPQPEEIVAVEEPSGHSSLKEKSFAARLLRRFGRCNIL